MRLIVEYDVYTIPVEYESKESFIRDLDVKLKDIATRACKAYNKTKYPNGDTTDWDALGGELDSGFELGGQVWSLYAFSKDTFRFIPEWKYTLPSVFELDEWFTLRLKEERGE